MKKYGGVNNQKTLYEMQEARIVSAPGISKIIKKQTRASIIFGWLVYLVASYIFTDLLVIIITDSYNRIKVPLWAIFLLPSIPFILTLVLKIVASLFNKKHTNHED